VRRIAPNGGSRVEYVETAMTERGGRGVCDSEWNMVPEQVPVPVADHRDGFADAALRHGSRVDDRGWPAECAPASEDGAFSFPGEPAHGHIGALVDGPACPPMLVEAGTSGIHDAHFRCVKVLVDHQVDVSRRQRAESRLAAFRASSGIIALDATQDWVADGPNCSSVTVLGPAPLPAIPAAIPSRARFSGKADRENWWAFSARR
jgi:hypothetical protein